jgi:cation/acetate symporter
MAKFNLHGTVNTAVIKGGDLYAPEASIKAEDRPDWMKRWEKTGLLKFTDKNGDGRIQYYNDATKNPEAKAKAEAAGWKGNELTVNADIIVLANPEIACCRTGLSPWSRLVVWLLLCRPLPVC